MTTINDDVIRERLKEICEMVVEEYEGGGGWQSVAREAKKILESLKLKVQHCNRDNGLDRDDIIRMARKAHHELVTKDYPGHAGQLDPWTMQLLERFAALVAAAEREACAEAVAVFGELVTHVIRKRGEK